MNAVEASKIKVGDQVTLYTYDELRKLNIAIGNSGDDNDAYYIKTPINVIPAMMPSLGKTLKVKKIGPYSDYPIDEEFDVGPGFYVELEDGINIDEADGGYFYDMLLIKKIEAPEKKEEEDAMFDMVKKVMKYMTDAFERWSEPTTGDKINSILWLVHAGYCDADRGAEMITEIIKKEG